MALKCASTMSAVWPSVNGAGGNTSSAEDPPACARFAIRAASRLPSAQMPWINGSRSPISLPAMSSTRLCSSAVHDATSVECALIVIADKALDASDVPQMAAKARLVDGEIVVERQQHRGYYPLGNKSLKRAMAISQSVGSMPGWRFILEMPDFSGNIRPAETKPPLLHDGDASARCRPPWTFAGGGGILIPEIS